MLNHMSAQVRSDRSGTEFDFGHLSGIARVLGGEADGGRQAGLCQEMPPCYICPLASPL